jgi:hypothetical protein
MKYETVEAAKQGLKEAVDTALAATGVFNASTCPTGEAFGWDMVQHYALEWFMRHPPENWHVSRIYRHECYDWTITQR